MTSSPPLSSRGSGRRHYRFEVTSAEQAVAAIHSHLGPTAQVLSVKSQSSRKWSRWFTAPKLEVIAVLPEPESTTPATQPEDLPAPETSFSAGAKATDDERPPAEAAGTTTMVSLLRRSGFPEKLIARWANRQALTETRPLHQVLADLGKELMPSPREPLGDMPPRIAFMGQAGVGRTTALSKWLAHETINQGRQGVVWRVEFDRPNPTPQVDIFAEAIGSSVEHYAPGITQLTTDFMVADMPPLPAVGSRQSAAFKRFLEQEEIAARVLVLNALFSPEALRSAYARGVELGATHLVVTHLDEIPRWGHLWEFLWEGDLIPLFASTGPELIGDVTFDVLDHVLQRTVPGSGRAVA